MDFPYQFSLSRHRRLHLAVCGSIAAYKALDLLRLWRRMGLHVGVTLTAAARHFITPLSFEALDAHPVYSDLFVGQEALYGHLEPGQNGDVFVVAPATANALAKLAHGLADDMFSCQALSFPGPFVLAPAMNPKLWNAPATQENITRLRDRGVSIVPPDTGLVACGEEGTGKLADPLAITSSILKALAPQDLAGRKILVTLGPTREFWDPVRFWSNPSTGRMGAAVATAAWLRGAQVHVVQGPCPAWLPPGIQVDSVTSAQEMYERSLSLWPSMDMACLTAAVCDFRPHNQRQQKFKKEAGEQGLDIAFAPNPDILQTLGSRKTPQQRLIGFAAETSDAIQSIAEEKLRRKQLDLILANRIDRTDAGFASATNHVVAVDAQGRHEQWPLMDKGDIAWRIWDWILAM